MQLTPLQLEIQKLGADMTLSFGCIIYTGYRYELYIGKSNTLAFNYAWSFRDTVSNIEPYYFNQIKVIGHPITYDRLCYLNITQSSDKHLQEFGDLSYAFLLNPELYKQSILEWDSITLNLVKDFLLSIQ